MAALSLRVSAQHLEPSARGGGDALREELAGKTHTSLIVLLCASAAVLLIACVNLANLLMSRGAVRRREVAVRAALGAGRGRLITQFLIESLVLAGLGAVAGLALAMPVDAVSGNAGAGDHGRRAADARLARAGVLRGDRHRRRIDVRTGARARRVAARLAGRTARRRPRQLPARAATGSSIRSSSSRRRSPSCC